MILKTVSMEKMISGLKKKNRNNIHTNDIELRKKMLIFHKSNFTHDLIIVRSSCLKTKPHLKPFVLLESFNHLPITFNTFIYITVFTVYTSNKELSCSFGCFPNLI